MKFIKKYSKPIQKHKNTKSAVALWNMVLSYLRIQKEKELMIKLFSLSNVSQNVYFHKARLQFIKYFKSLT